MHKKRLVNKRIEHHSLNEIFEIIESSKNLEKIKSAKSELQRRNLAQSELFTAKKNFENFKNLKAKRKEEELTFSEWFSFFFVLQNARSYFSSSENFNDSELERYLIHGYDKKYDQAIYTKKLGLVFFYLIIPIWVIVIIKWTN